MQIGSIVPDLGPRARALQPRWRLIAAFSPGVRPSCWPSCRSARGRLLVGGTQGHLGLIQRSGHGPGWGTFQMDGKDCHL
jgi:hypothetical protein